MTNLLVNPHMLAEATTDKHKVTYWTTADPNQAFYITDQRHQLTRPEGWGLWVEHAEEADLPWDPGAGGWVVPEIKLGEEAYRDQRWLKLPDGTWARPLQAFCSYRHTRCGPFQTVTVQAGKTYSLTAWAHAWSSNKNQPDWSDGCGTDAFSMPFDEIPAAYAGDPGVTDALQSVVFRIGADPTGGVDPFGPAVVWGPRWAIYNKYAQLPVLDVTAQGDKLTVFGWMENRWRNLHNDRYLTAFSLTEKAGSPPIVLPPQEPSVQPMMPPGLHLTTGASGAEDEARALHDQIAAEFPGATLEQLAAAMPPMKAYGTPELALTLKLFRDINPHWRTTFRLSGIPGSSINVEGPSLDPDPVTAARRYMDGVLQAIAPYRQYITLLELINEQDPPGVDGQRRLALFMKECGRIAKDSGLRVGLFSHSLGVPEWDEMQAIVETGALDGDNVELCLHEYAWPLDEDFGQAIPGYTGETADKGPLAFRYRFWLELLRQRGLRAPISITEMNTATKFENITGDEWKRQIRWYLTEAAKDPEVVEVDLFGWGSLGNSWKGFDVRQVRDHWRELALEAARGILSAPAPAPQPVEGYDRYVLVVDYNHITDPEIRELLYAEGQARGITTTPSWDDARRRPEGAKSNTIEAPGIPEALQPAIRAYVLAEDPGAVVIFRDLGQGGSAPVPTPPATSGIKPYCQRDQPWAQVKLGRSGYTMYGSGCLVTGIASWLTLTDPDMDPLKLVVWLNANNSFDPYGNLFVAKPAQISPAWEYVAYHTWRKPGQKADLATVRRLLEAGPAILQVDFKPATSKLDSHFVLALRFTDAGDDIVVMDPWTGKIVELLDTYGPGRTLETAIFAALEYRRVDSSPAPPAAPPLLGFNDPENTGAGRWMMENAGNLLHVPIAIGTGGGALDFRVEEAQGIRVIVNARYGWSNDCGGAGTIPRPNTDEWRKFVAATVSTIKASRGVWEWELFNEFNNPREFPKGYELKPMDVALTYNAIREQVPGVRLAVGALDPYHASRGEPRAWLTETYNAISGAEFIAAHGYVRGPDPALVGSDAKFADAPMQWQYLNFPGCVTELLKALPARFRDLPVYVTEFNHLWKDGGERPGNEGWVTDGRAGEIIKRAYAAARTAGFAALAVYRWNHDAWAVAGNGAVKGAVAEILG